ncbi:C-type lectin domain family 4 member G-like [Haliotis rubra]|uniref:C-type lectin domain family 4 member G-like n=1 Tax=Haliotis rubra TaxID=36100 RepID=UPI001EE50288|nr:C-type lectin domain family 4 member G-like [Haliotis rubra]
MKLVIMLCLQLLFALSNGIQSTFELLTQPNNDFSKFGYQEATVSTGRHDECASHCAQNPRCSVFKYDIPASLCTTLVPDRFNWVSAEVPKAQESVYAYTDTGWCPVEQGYIFLRDIQMCIWVSSTTADNDTAVIQCGQHGGRLIILSDSNKWEIISKMGLDPLTTGLTVLVRVGADDSTVPGTYVWGDGHPVNNSLWNVGEPNSLTEHCVSISNGALYDIPCSMEVYFICEIHK